MGFYVNLECDPKLFPPTAPWGVRDDEEFMNAINKWRILVHLDLQLNAVDERPLLHQL
jgi:hypothetical protein